MATRDALPPEFRDHDGPAAGRLPRHPAGLARGGRDPADRARLAVRSPAADRRRPDGPIFEGWTLLSALAAQTERLRLGLLVTSNRFRPPAMLAKIAATVDIVSGGRLDFGIGAGSRPSIPLARREYEAHGLPYHDSAHAVGSLAEACTVIRRLWTEDEPFDFDGSLRPPHRCVRQPQARPAAPSADHDRRALGRDAARGRRARRPVEHPRRRHRRRVSRSALLDRFCAEIGRDPAAITRSIYLPVSYDQPGRTRTRSPRPSTRASGTSCSACRPLPGRRRPLGRRRAHHPQPGARHDPRKLTIPPDTHILIPGGSLRGACGDPAPQRGRKKPPASPRGARAPPLTRDWHTAAPAPNQR